jgi:hypothetical protein
MVVMGLTVNAFLRMSHPCLGLRAAATAADICSAANGVCFDHLIRPRAIIANVVMLARMPGPIGPL